MIEWNYKLIPFRDVRKIINENLYLNRPYCNEISDSVLLRNNNNNNNNLYNSMGKE